MTTISPNRKDVIEQGQKYLDERADGIRIDEFAVMEVVIFSAEHTEEEK